MAWKEKRARAKNVSTVQEWTILCCVPELKITGSSAGFRIFWMQKCCSEPNFRMLKNSSEISFTMNNIIAIAKLSRKNYAESIPYYSVFKPFVQFSKEADIRKIHEQFGTDTDLTSIVTHAIQWSLWSKSCNETWWWYWQNNRNTVEMFSGRQLQRNFIDFESNLR